MVVVMVVMMVVVVGNEKQKGTAKAGRRGDGRQDSDFFDFFYTFWVRPCQVARASRRKEPPRKKGFGWFKIETKNFDIERKRVPTSK